MDNFIEQLVAEYYKTKGYLVMTNYWIPFKSERVRVKREKSENYSARSWIDIDVLARNKNELLIIQVKSIINEKRVADKIIQYFKRVEKYLEYGIASDNISSIKWWCKDCRIKKIVIYEFNNSSYLKILSDNDIEVKLFQNYYNEIRSYISKKEGFKEQNASMRLLHFLDKNNLLK